MMQKAKEQFCQDSAEYMEGNDSHRKQRSYRRWTDFENNKYGKFLQREEKNFVDQTMRRKKKVFVRLSKIIRTKSIGQCKSHHQKMIKKYTTIACIIQKYALAKASSLTTISFNEKETKPTDYPKQRETQSLQFYEQQKFQSLLFQDDDPIFSVLDLGGPKTKIQSPECF